MEDADAAVVRRNLEAVERQDFDAIAATLAPDVVQYYQRPTGRRDDGTLAAAFKQGRDAIIEEIRSHFYVTLYKPGTARIVIERLISTSGWVAAQFSLSALTFSKSEPYENFYFFLYEVKDGQITRYWEYVDTAYANAKLFG
jgi:ketosteroid isomerase-like protein